MLRNVMLMNCKTPFYDADGGAGAGGAGGDNGNGSDNGKNNEPLNFDDFLKQGKNRAEFDRRVNKAIETAVGNERERLAALHNDKLTEVEKLAKMNETERAQYLDQKRNKEIAEREAKITRRELTAEAKETLAGKGLPTELSEICNVTDAEACKVSIDTIEKTFREAVEKAVEEKLKGDKPPKDASTEGHDKDSAIDAQIKAALGIKVRR